MTGTVFAVKHGFPPIELILGAIFSWYSGQYCDCIQPMSWCWPCDIRRSDESRRYRCTCQQPVRPCRCLKSLKMHEFKCGIFIYYFFSSRTLWVNEIQSPVYVALEVLDFSFIMKYTVTLKCCTGF